MHVNLEYGNLGLDSVLKILRRYVLEGEIDGDSEILQILNPMKYIYNLQFYTRQYQYGRAVGRIDKYRQIFSISATFSPNHCYIKNCVDFPKL